MELKGDPELPPSGITVANVKIGRVVWSLSEISDCYDVSINGLSLGPEGTVDYVPEEYVAEGESAEAFADAGSWNAIIGRVKPGDRVILKFPRSPQRDLFAWHVKDQGGVPVVAGD